MILRVVVTALTLSCAVGCAATHEPLPDGNHVAPNGETVRVCHTMGRALDHVVFWFDTTEGGVCLDFFTGSHSFDGPPASAFLTSSDRELECGEFTTSSGVWATEARGRLKVHDHLAVSLRGWFAFPRDDREDTIVVVDFKHLPGDYCRH